MAHERGDRLVESLTLRDEFTQLRWLFGTNSMRLASTCSVAGAVLLVIVIAWGLNRGFDFSDEGLYVSRFAEPAEASPLWQYERLLLPLIPGDSPGIVGLRALRLLLTLVSATTLGIGLWLWTERWYWLEQYRSRTCVGWIGTATLGALLSYSYFPIALSYNSVTLIILMLVIGLGLAVISGLQEGRIVRLGRFGRYVWLVSLGGVGFFACAMIFVKFTSGIVLVVVLTGVIPVLAVGRGHRPFALLGVVGVMAVGALLMLVYFTLTGSSVSTWIGELRLAVANLQSHHPSILLRMYGSNIVRAMWDGVWKLVALPIGGYVLIRLYSASAFSTTRVRSMTLGIYGVLVTYSFVTVWRLEWFKSGASHQAQASYPHVVMMLSFVAMLVAVLEWRDVVRVTGTVEGRAVLVVGGVLWAMPFIGAVGTGNSILLQSVQYYAGWFGLYLLIAIFIGLRSGRQWFGAVMLLATFALCIAQTLHGFVYSPYRQAASLTEQELPLEFAAGETMKLDATTREFVVAIRDVIAEKTSFRQGDPMIASDRMPGLVYVLGGRTPGAKWYVQTDPVRNCYNLSRAHTLDSNRLIVLSPNAMKLHDGFVGCLQARGVDFPGGYVNLGSFEHPLGGQRVSVLVPKAMRLDNGAP